MTGPLKLSWDKGSLMTSSKSWTHRAATLCAAIALCHAVPAQVSSDAPRDKTAQARTAFAHALPRLDGSHLRVTIVEVRYGPGESSPASQSSLPSHRLCSRRSAPHAGEGPTRGHLQNRREFLRGSQQRSWDIEHHQESPSSPWCVN